jgi:hypothetical protein
MNTQRTLAGAFLALCLNLFADPARAQDGKSAGIGSEHRYRFAWEGELSSLQEKLITESIVRFDPEMRVVVDRQERALKLLAYHPLQESTVRAAAAEHGIVLRVRRESTEAPTPRNEQ